MSKSICLLLFILTVSLLKAETAEESELEAVIEGAQECECEEEDQHCSCRDSESGRETKGVIVGGGPLFLQKQALKAEIKKAAFKADENLHLLKKATHKLHKLHGCRHNCRRRTIKAVKVQQVYKTKYIAAANEVKTLKSLVRTLRRSEVQLSKKVSAKIKSNLNRNIAHQQNKLKSLGRLQRRLKREIRHAHRDEVKPLLKKLSKVSSKVAGIAGKISAAKKIVKGHLRRFSTRRHTRKVGTKQVRAVKKAFKAEQAAQKLKTKIRIIERKMARDPEDKSELRRRKMKLIRAYRKLQGVAKRYTKIMAKIPPKKLQSMMRIEVINAGRKQIGKILKKITLKRKMKKHEAKSKEKKLMKLGKLIDSGRLSHSAKKRLIRKAKDMMKKIIVLQKQAKPYIPPKAEERIAKTITTSLKERDRSFDITKEVEHIEEKLALPTTTKEVMKKLLEKRAHLMDAFEKAVKNVKHNERKLMAVAPKIAEKMFTKVASKYITHKGKEVKKLKKIEKKVEKFKQKERTPPILNLKKRFKLVLKEKKEEKKLNKIARLIESGDISSRKKRMLKRKARKLLDKIYGLKKKLKLSPPVKMLNRLATRARKNLRRKGDTFKITLELRKIEEKMADPKATKQVQKELMAKREDLMYKYEKLAKKIKSDEYRLSVYSPKLLQKVYTVVSKPEMARQKVIIPKVTISKVIKKNVKKIDEIKTILKDRKTSRKVKKYWRRKLNKIVSKVRKLKAKRKHEIKMLPARVKKAEKKVARELAKITKELKKAPAHYSKILIKAAKKLVAKLQKLKRHSFVKAKTVQKEAAKKAKDIKYRLFTIRTDLAKAPRKFIGKLKAEKRRLEKQLRKLKKTEKLMKKIEKKVVVKVPKKILKFAKVIKKAASKKTKCERKKKCIKGLVAIIGHTDAFLNKLIKMRKQLHKKLVRAQLKYLC